MDIILNNSSFYTDGFFIIDKFLDEKISIDILNQLKKEKSWHRIDQERDHYKEGGPFNLRSKYFPGNKETYYQTSWRAKEFEKRDDWRETYKKYFLEKISCVFNRNVIYDTTYIIRYKKNDFSRIHTDDLRGDVERVDVGLLYYLCDDWKWDWGGNLMISKNEDDSEMRAILPIHNRLVVINNQKRCPHYISQVAHYAKNDRFTVASFIGCDKPLDGNYD